MQGPGQYLLALGIELTCVVHPERPAVIDAHHRMFVNYDTYYFSGADALESFAAAPHNYIGVLTDPVTQERFSPVAGSPRRTTGDRMFYFASSGSAARFDEAPVDFAATAPAMVPVSGP